MKRIKQIDKELRDYVNVLLEKYPEINSISIEVDINRREFGKDISIYEYNKDEK